MHVVVTGGAGFIGSAVVRLLADAPGITVAVLDDLSAGDAGNLRGVDAELVQASVLDAEAVEHAVRGADSVVHLAALNSVSDSVAHPLPVHEVNTTGTFTVLDACRRQGAHLVLASSSSVYGRKEPGRPELDPASPYAASKLAGEIYASTWATAYGLPSLVLRFFNVFGPFQRPVGEHPAVIPAFIDAALDDRAVTIFGSGRQSRDFVSVDVVAAVIVQAVVERISAPHPIDIGNGTSTDLLQVVELLEQLTGRPIRVQHRPERAGDVTRSLADVRELDRLFPDRPVRPLAEALAATLEWATAVRREAAARHP
jgi:UDP-glucose 4-epimerase